MYEINIVHAYKRCRFNDLDHSSIFAFARMYMYDIILCVHVYSMIISTFLSNFLRSWRKALHTIMTA